MSFIRITKTNTDTSTLVLHPSRSFSSSSSGVTGSVRVIAQSSPFFKEASKSGPFVDSPLEASSIDELRIDTWLAANSGSNVISTPASASITGSITGGSLNGLTLSFRDGAGNLFSATTDDSMAGSAGTAVMVGTNGVSSNHDLIFAVWTSVYEAMAYGVDSVTKATRAGPKLRIDVPTITGDGAANSFLNIKMSDVGYQGNNPVYGTMSGSNELTVFPFAGGKGPSSQTLFKTYMNKVNSASMAARQKKYVEVLRFIPTNTFTSDTMRKSAFRSVLMPKYKTSYPDLEWAFMNNQCFNFVSSSAFPSASCLIYPDPTDQYLIMSGLTVSCNVKLNRTVLGSHPYTAGTLIFRSSSYALSVHSGSSRDPDGKVNAFRLMMQLSSACDTPPKDVNLSSLPANTFLSRDNALKYNNWHNVAFSWGASHNQGSGSFYVDGDHDVEYAVSTSPINQSTDDFNAVFIGAHYSGSAEAMPGYFNSTVAATEGIYNGGIGQEPLPGALTGSRFNGEINDIRIYGERISDDRIKSGSMVGLTTVPRGMIFYAPGFFVKESPKRSVLLTPFQSTTEATEEPFNVKLAYGVRGRDINVQNYCRDFVQKKYPRLYCLTASAITTSTETYTANSFLLDIGPNRDMHRARGMFILPSDNGKFIPGWNLLRSGTIEAAPSQNSNMSLFVNDLGNLNVGIVSLNNLMPTSSIFEGLTQTNSDGTDDTAHTGILQEIMGSSPENAGADPGSGYTILQRTRDNSSNAVVFFDASNLFYGKQIMPHSIRLIDSALSGTSSGSTGYLPFKVKDNGRGTLYRADAASIHATWSAIGYTIYEEGISVITSPVIPFFGKNQFDIDMRGEQSLHVLEVNAPALQGMLNSSSNPSFVPGTRDNYASNYEGTALGISSVLFHDNNMNIVARTTLAQPILKTEFDKYMFRVKFDF